MTSLNPILSITLFATLLAASGARAQEPPMWLFGDVSFPSRVDTFKALGAEVSLDGPRGTALHYGTPMAPRATVDVIVQPLPGGRDDPEVVRQEFQRTLEELERYTGNGRDRVSVSVDTVRAVSVEAGGWTFQGHVAEATVRGGGGRAGRTLAYVFAKPPSFVKIRITHAPAFKDELDPRIHTFVREILTRMESFQDRRTSGGT
ncbi:MAG TPA: hypothetical protein VE173_15800 [Longimicrobiales bacterium]|nr:hypothetical protein [Longimicrobiales bacterium]